VNAKRNLRPATLVMAIDIDRRIRFVQQYPNNVGRNFYEVLRVVDSMQLSLFHQVVTPANWSQGEEVFIHPGLSSSAAAPMFPKGFNEVRDWCRVTSQPDV
jgi:thioredoxin-dependent peroxiredoxin